MSLFNSQELDRQRALLCIEQIKDLSSLISQEIDFVPHLPLIFETAATYLNARVGYLFLSLSNQNVFESFGLSKQTQKKLKDNLTKVEEDPKVEIVQEEIGAITDHLFFTIRGVNNTLLGQCVFINKESREGGQRFTPLDHSLAQVLMHLLEAAASKYEQYEEQKHLAAFNDSLLNASSGAIIALRTDGVPTWFNHKAESWFDLSQHRSESFLSLLPKNSPIRKFIASSMERDIPNMSSSLPLSARDRKFYRVYVAPFTTDQKAHSYIISLEDETELRKIKDTFSKYVSKDVLNVTLNSNHSARLGGERKKCAIFFSDIRGFTSYSESKDPEEVVETLNQYFNAMIVSINENNGSVDKLVGDEIMAVFHHQEGLEHPVLRVVKTALSMKESLLFFNTMRKEQGLEPLFFGIGINYGEVISGNIGSIDRMDYTIIGDNVNIAARCCGFARPDEIIVSDKVYEIIKERYVCEELKPIHFKGKSKKVDIYELKGTR